MATYKELEVGRVRVTATITFDAYVQISAPDVDGLVDTYRLGNEIQDAVEYHAPHLRDSEDSDCLIAIRGGGSGDCVTIVSLDVSEPIDATDDEVEDAVEATGAWVW